MEIVEEKFTAMETDSIRFLKDKRKGLDSFAFSPMNMGCWH